MPNPLISKLEHGADLTDDDRDVLTDVTRRTYLLKARQDIIQEGERPETVHLVIDGLACRYKVLEDGCRQIMALLVPGDFCDLQVALLDSMDHSIGSLSACTIVDIPRSTILDLTNHHPRITRALWWCSLVDEGTLREWLVNLGRRDADHRMMHLFCELLVRYQTVGRADVNSFELPITQYDLGELLGISAVHTNRTLQTLRDANLLEFHGKRVRLPDVEQIKSLCGFDPNYLHLTRRQNGD